MNTHGSKWIRREKRLAIYIRDGMACAYCGATVEDGAQLTLDHVKPRSADGSHHESNLITACMKCNSSRGDRSVAGFARSVASYLSHEIKASDITKHIRNCQRRTLDIAGAKAIMAARGSWTATING